MNLIFFGDEEVFSYLKSEASFAPKLMTVDEEECLDWLEENAEDKRVYLFIDYDIGKKKVDKFILNLRNEFPKLVAILVYENLKIRELKKHQKGKYAADGYLKKPIGKENLEAVLEDFELGEFLTKKNLSEEGTALPPIPALGSESDDTFSENVAMPALSSEEQAYADDHQGEMSALEGDDVNSGIQQVFDQTMSGITNDLSASNLTIQAEEDSDDLDLPMSEEFDEGGLDLSEGSSDFAGLDIEEEEQEEIGDESALSFDLNEEEIGESSLNTGVDLSSPDLDIDNGDLSMSAMDGAGLSLNEDFNSEENQLEVDSEDLGDELAEDENSTLVISSDELLSLKEDGDDSEDATEDDVSLGDDNMDQNNEDDLFEDDLDLELGTGDDLEEVPVDKTIVEKYEPEEDGDLDIGLGDLDDSLDSELESELEDELGDDFIDDFSNNDAMSLDDDLDDDGISLDEDITTEGQKVEKDSEITQIPADEDLEFPSLSELDGSDSEGSKAFEVEDFDEDAVDETLSQIVQTGSIQTDLKQLDNVSFEDDDFAIDDDSDDKLMDINKIDLSENKNEIVDDEIDFATNEKASKLPEKPDMDSLQFDNSAENTNDQIGALNTTTKSIEGPDNNDNTKEGLVFANVENQQSISSHERPLGADSIEDHKLVSGHHQNELLRLQTIIRQLREEREELLENINTLESDKKVLDRDNLGFRAEVDELKIELGIIRKRHREELEEIKYKNRISEEKKLLAQEKSKKLDRELSRLQQRIHIDLNKVRQREKELESKLELAKIDSDSQVKARDQKIIELKRKIDQLEFNMENVAMKEQQSRTEKIRTEERLSRIMKTLRGSIELLEDDIQYDSENEE